MAPAPFVGPDSMPCMMGVQWKGLGYWKKYAVNGVMDMTNYTDSNGLTSDWKTCMPLTWNEYYGQSMTVQTIYLAVFGVFFVIMTGCYVYASLSNLKAKRDKTKLQTFLFDSSCIPARINVMSFICSILWLNYLDPEGYGLLYCGGRNCYQSPIGMRINQVFTGLFIELRTMLMIFILTEVITSWLLIISTKGKKMQLSMAQTFAFAGIKVVAVGLFTLSVLEIYMIPGIQPGISNSPISGAKLFGVGFVILMQGVIATIFGINIASKVGFTFTDLFKSPDPKLKKDKVKMLNRLKKLRNKFVTLDVMSTLVMAGYILPNALGRFSIPYRCPDEYARLVVSANQSTLYYPEEGFKPSEWTGITYTEQRLCWLSDSYWYDLLAVIHAVCLMCFIWLLPPKPKDWNKFRKQIGLHEIKFKKESAMNSSSMAASSRVASTAPSGMNE